jgi:hypothetical protein
MRKTGAFLSVMTASVVLALPTFGLARSEPPPPRPAMAAHNITDQLATLNATIDHYVTQGRLSQAEAVVAHRQVNALEDQANAYRESNGGVLSEAERFTLQTKIDDLNAQIDRARSAPGGARSN